MSNGLKTIFQPILTVLFATFIGLGSGISTPGSDSYSNLAADHPPVSDDALHANTVPGLLLSEMSMENDSEIEPKGSAFPATSLIAEAPYGNISYLGKSKLILISLKIRDLIYPFHTHL